MDEEKIPEYVFPIVECHREKNTLVLKTTIRKKHRGKYFAADWLTLQDRRIA